MSKFDIKRFRPEFVHIEVHKRNRGILGEYFEQRPLLVDYKHSDSTSMHSRSANSAAAHGTVIRAFEFDEQLMMF